MNCKIKTLLSSLSLLLLAGTAAAERPIDFNRDIRPILSDNCFTCHGPDDRARKAGLRLDVSEGALADRGGYQAIVPGDADASTLMQRVADDDPYRRMPPPSTNKEISAQQQELLRRWIEEGAEYQPHWAFAAPQRPELPEVESTDWPRNAIDYFILQQLEQHDLSPSPEADRYTLVRRLYLDLLGFPPTPEEADAFVRDSRPDAYERLVDRLLASPYYGERWARRWLDLARYADTNGYEKDRPRSIWPFRDWVIQALNDDKPFDQFTIEQIAGDLLPGATLQQQIATGFHRNTMLNEEGGIDPLEYRFHAMTDRVGTTGQVWLGLTTACAQCHTHKYDPITINEYFELFAFLNNADEPEIELPDPDIEARRAELKQQIQQLEAGLAEQFPAAPADGENDARTKEQRRRDHLEQQFATWREQTREGLVAWQTLAPLQASSNLPLLTILDDDSILASGDQTKSDTYEIRYRVDQPEITAFRLDVLPDERLPAHGPGRTYYEGRKGDFFLSKITVLVDGRPVDFREASENYASLSIGSGDTGAALAIDGDPLTGWSTSGREGEPHHAVFVLDQPLRDVEEIVVTMLFERHFAAGLGRFRLSGTSTDQKPQARDVSPEIEALLLKPESDWTSDQHDLVLRHFLSIAPELEEARKPIDKLRDQLPDYPTTLVFDERPPENPRPTFVHNRGEFLQPEEQVEPSVPEVLHPLPDDAPRDRLTFARWLVSEDNPLVGRVTVNRHWSALFGQGIVRTEEDFGSQGAAPTHPELLDWLAVEFKEQGWSMKQLHRLLVSSSTYRQSSRVTPELRKVDPDNRLLARGPRTRLEAELIRDSLLQASGLFSRSLGGPSVFPPQPPTVTTEGAFGRFEWQASQGGDRYRRGLYTFSKRTAPYAMFATFDAPSGEACVVRREVSNTPLQALTLLNDQVVIEAAQALGRRMAKKTSSDAESLERQMQRLVQHCLTRPAEGDELQWLIEFFHAQRERLEAGQLDAEEIVGREPASSDEAAWTLVARSVFNLDEMVTKP